MTRISANRGHGPIVAWAGLVMGALWTADARADAGQLVLLPTFDVPGWDAAVADTGGPVDAVSREGGGLVDAGNSTSDASTRAGAILSDIPDAATPLSSREGGGVPDGVRAPGQPTVPRGPTA